MSQRFRSVRHSLKQLHLARNLSLPQQEDYAAMLLKDVCSGHIFFFGGRRTERVSTAPRLRALRLIDIIEERLQIILGSKDSDSAAINYSDPLN